MSTYDDSLLGARFALLAPEPLPGSWEDVLGRAGATRKSGRRRLVIAFAVVAVAAAIAAAAVGGVRDFVLRTGFIGLPPIGATPSSPASGELEICLLGQRTLGCERERKPVEPALGCTPTGD